MVTPAWSTSGCTAAHHIPSEPTGRTATGSWRSWRDQCRWFTLGDVQAVSGSLTGKPNSRARTLAAVNSLLAFGQRTGYLPLNVGAAVKLPARKNTLAEWILTQPDVVRILALEPDRRNKVLLRLLYIAGLRVSEIAALTWRDVQPRTDDGQVTVFGERSKTRVVWSGLSPR